MILLYLKKNYKHNLASHFKFYIQTNIHNPLRCLPDLIKKVQKYLF